MKVNKKVVIADIKSLYPSVAGLCGNESKILGFKTYYPIGKTTWVKKWDITKLGFYTCSVNHQIEKLMNVIPRRSLN